MNLLLELIIFTMCFTFVKSQSCSYGTYGVNCSDSCSTKCSNKRCNHVTGKCDNCEPGYQGARCQEALCKTQEWFGPGCKYKCHCEEDKCDYEGRCIDNYKCSKGWFGDSCQYQDLATVPDAEIRTNIQQNTERLLDRNDKTCFTTNYLPNQYVSITLTSPYKFTWLQINFDSYSTPLGTVTATLKFFKNHGEIQNFTCEEKSFLSQESLIIKCDVRQEVTKVEITGTILISICSLYISGACGPGTFGKKCEHPCPKYCSCAHCDHVNGKCESCVPGYHGKWCDQGCYQNEKGERGDHDGWPQNDCDNKNDATTDEVYEYIDC